MPQDRIQVARVLDRTSAEGPGQRTAIWVQGCSVRCPGCFNPHLWPTSPDLSRDTATFVEDVLNRARRAGVEGLTLLGGEPFDQAAPLATLAASAQEASLTVMTFTGYRLQDLRSWSADRSDINAVLQHTDLLLDGPYLRDRPDPQRSWIGSKNQGINHLSNRYVDVAPSGDKIEVRIAADGTISANGWANDEQLDLLLGELGTRNDRISDSRP